MNGRRNVARRLAMLPQAHIRMGPGLILVCALTLAACAAPRTELPLSPGHLTNEPIASEQAVAQIPPTAPPRAFVPPPSSRPLTYSVVVHEVPVKELLLALARDTEENIDVHPGLQGVVSSRHRPAATAILDWPPSSESATASRVTPSSSPRTHPS